MDEKNKLKDSILCITKSFRLTWKYEKSYFLFALLSAVLNSSLATLPPLIFLQNVLNGIAQRNITARQIIFSLVAALIYEALALPIVIMLVQYLRKYMTYKASLRYSEHVYRKVIAIKADLLENSDTYELYRRVSNRGLSSFEIYPSSIIGLLINIISIATIITMASRYNLWIALILVPMCVCQYFLNRKINKKKIWYDKVQEILYTKMQSINNLFIDRNALCEIKVFGTFSFLDSKRIHFFNAEKHEYIKQATISTKSDLMFEIVKQVTYYSLYIIYAFMVFSKSILFGDFIFLTSNISKVMNSVRSIIGAISGFVTNQEYFNEHELFFSLPERANGTKKFDEKDPKNILTDKLSYGYSAERKVLNSLCMEIKEGEKVCVFGDNGAGKTTLIKLICGLYEDYRGKILLQNNERHSYGKDEIRNLYSYAMQDGPHYPFTVKENICMGNTADADNQNLYDKVCSVSGINQIVSQLRYGENTYLNKEYDTNGVDLSIGQWQKLLIAKIMFRNKEILIFDEPTSALDPLAEQEFINTLLSWYKNKTVVIISHRMTFASIADRVFVIKDGAVAEQGTPKQLLNAKGLFYEYFNTQRSLYF
jgi:ABC-type bacteriocin/lantibiotic exporter with double-glycine peptidase domain